MRSPTTGRAAGRIDLVLASSSTEKYFGLEIQAVYFSGKGMGADFEALAEDSGELPPAPSAIRRPDWRSSSAKRLMPQLQIKAPTLRRWGTKLAVSVDRNFFADLGGPSNNPVRDLDEGDIIWLIPNISGEYQLERFHWEVLSLEDSCDKLLSAKTVKRSEFEDALRAKLQRSGLSARMLRLAGRRLGLGTLRLGTRVRRGLGKPPSRLLRRGRPGGPSALGR